VISIRKHIERLAGDDDLRNAFLEMVGSLFSTTRDRMLVTDPTEHAWFCTNLEALEKRLVADPKPKNIGVVSALLNKTLADHWTRLAHQAGHREEELKRIINLLAEGAGRLDTTNNEFYKELRTTVQTFQNLSQLEDLTYMRKKLSEQVTELQETVQKRERAASEAILRLQSELGQAQHQVAQLVRAESEDRVTRLPARAEALKLIGDRIESRQPFTVAVAVIERLDVINLRHGADCGDDVLREFAKKLRDQLPQSAAVCRWGGPAFVAMLEHIGAAEARLLVQKILASIAVQPFEMHSKGKGLLHITSKYSFYEWAEGETVDKVARVIEAFCASQRFGLAEAAEPQP